MCRTISALGLKYDFGGNRVLSGAGWTETSWCYSVVKLIHDFNSLYRWYMETLSSYFLISNHLCVTDGFPTYKSRTHAPQRGQKTNCHHVMLDYIQHFQYLEIQQFSAN